MNAGTETNEEKRKPVLVAETLHEQVKVKVAKLRIKMQDAADEMASDWLRKPAKKGN
jgi:methyl coenzyme M reductase subunit D